MRLTIIGAGHVGLVTALCFAERGNEVLCVDHDAAKVARLSKGEATFHEPGVPQLLAKHGGRAVKFSSSTAEGTAFGEVIFICVSTPSLPGGGVDMRYFEAVSRDIAAALTSYRVIVEKSTVPIRTAEHVKRTVQRHAANGGRDAAGNALFDVASNPEFLREGAAVKDTLEPDRIVIGVESERAEKLMRGVYAGFSAPVMVTGIPSAEMIKLASNAFLATKISFINAISRICELGGADVAEVARGMGLDPRIGRHFLGAGIGYGGSCFPKDVDGLIHVAADLGYPVPLLAEVQRINRDQCAHLVDAVRDELWVLAGKRVALWGLAFKPDTDDIRESPALRIAAALIAEGATVAGYDPVAGANAVAACPGLKLASSAADAAAKADALIVATEWPEFTALSQNPASLAALKRTMRVPAVFDGRNCLDAAAWRTAGFTLRGMGR
jgi:UDPglucose 6-dehydrogenase